MSGLSLRKTSGLWMSSSAHGCPAPCLRRREESRTECQQNVKAGGGVCPVVCVSAVSTHRVYLRLLRRRKKAWRSVGASGSRPFLLEAASPSLTVCMLLILVSVNFLPSRYDCRGGHRCIHFFNVSALQRRGRWESLPPVSTTVTRMGSRVCTPKIMAFSFFAWCGSGDWSNRFHTDRLESPTSTSSFVS